MPATNLILMEKNYWWVHLFFGGHTGDNKMGRAVSVKENFKMLTGNITQATTITSNYTIDTFATTTNCNWRTANIRSSSTTVSSKIAEECPRVWTTSRSIGLTVWMQEQYGTFETQRIAITDTFLRNKTPMGLQQFLQCSQYG